MVTREPGGDLWRWAQAQKSFLVFPGKTEDLLVSVEEYRAAYLPSQQLDRKVTHGKTSGLSTGCRPIAVLHGASVGLERVI